MTDKNVEAVKCLVCGVTFRVEPLCQGPNAQGLTRCTHKRADGSVCRRAFGHGVTPKYTDGKVIMRVDPADLECDWAESPEIDWSAEEA